MLSQPITSLTLEDIRTLIVQIVDERLVYWQQGPRPQDLRSLQERFAAMERLRWTPPPGMPTVTQMIIDEREQWRRGM